ncbi:MAG TPA: glycoside hydrolase family 127 protein, partial [Verrucomicrobiae bacterium]|nr:glycoside hydrolase family 127 protein [Verrucomicrobiae bacterium]
MERLNPAGSGGEPRALQTLRTASAAVGTRKQECARAWALFRPRELLLLVILTLGWRSLPGVARADALVEPNPKQKVHAVVPLQVHAFPLGDVRLLDGPFKHAMELDEKYLLSLEVDRLLHNFRVNAGLPSNAEPLGGWEEPKGELRGHFVGHYLSACALMYASTGDHRFKEKGDAVVAGLAECQARLGSGYLSAFPETFIDRVEKPSRVWAPYYTLHKILAGLLDMYEYCDNQQALDVAKKFGDWVVARNSLLSDEKMQTMLGTEHGGMNEALANLYGFTGEDKYLKISLRFNHHRVIDPAARGEDKLTGLHANTQIPKFIGTARQYELSAEPALKSASLFFWNTVVKERSYVIGGHSDGEMFTAKERLSKALGPNTTETCNTYNMLKLTRHLFCWEPQAQYADYYERALLNHILASQNPETGMMCYYLPLRAGSRKNYNGPTDSFWCCTGTGVENHSKYAGSIYFHDDRTLYVNLFIASELDWKERGVKVQQVTEFPDRGRSRLVFTCEKPIEIKVKVRHPSWAKQGFEIRLNGESLAPDTSPGTWVDLERTWRTGDTIQISMPFSLRTEAFKDNQNRFAYLNGPVVLCAEVGPKPPFPAVVADQGQIVTRFEAVPGQPNTFSSSKDLFRLPGAPDTRIVLSPLYKMHGERHYVVYWDRYSPEEWRGKEQAYAAE